METQIVCGLETHPSSGVLSGVVSAGELPPAGAKSRLEFFAKNGRLVKLSMYVDPPSNEMWNAWGGENIFFRPEIIFIRADSHCGV